MSDLEVEANTLTGKQATQAYAGGLGMRYKLKAQARGVQGHGARGRLGLRVPASLASFALPTPNLRINNLPVYGVVPAPTWYIWGEFPPMCRLCKPADAHYIPTTTERGINTKPAWPVNCSSAHHCSVCAVNSIRTPDSVPQKIPTQVSMKSSDLQVADFGTASSA